MYTFTGNDEDRPAAVEIPTKRTKNDKWDDDIDINLDDDQPFRSYDEVCIDIESIFGSLTKEVKSVLEEMTPKSKKVVFRRVSFSSNR